jgi:hypothetical protein
LVVFDGISLVDTPREGYDGGWSYQEERWRAEEGYVTILVKSEWSEGRDGR